MKRDAFRYGSDETGLIWGYRFAAGSTPVAIDARQALHWLAERPGDSGRDFIWLHFNLTNTATEKWFLQNGVVADEFLQSLHEPSRSTRIGLAENSLIAVVNDVSHRFSFEASDISTVWMSVDQRTVISARSTPLTSIERVRHAVECGEEFRSSVEILTHLLRDQSDVLVDIVRESVERVDKVEDSLLAGRVSQRRADLGTLRRVLVRLRRLLAPEPASLFRLLQRPPTWMMEEDAEELRQATEEFAVVLNDMSSLQERIKLLQEEIAAAVNEENSRSLFVLTIVTVLALPINIVAGLLGMNVGGVPLADHPYGFWIIFGIVIGFTAVAGCIAIRKQRND